MQEINTKIKANITDKVYRADVDVAREIEKIREQKKRVKIKNLQSSLPSILPSDTLYAY